MNIEKRLEKVRLQLVLNDPFFGVLLSSLESIKDNKFCPTMATDGKRIYYNEKFVGTLTDRQLKFVFMHELMHVAYMHCSNARLRDRNRMKWNIACDFVINLELNDCSKSGSKYEPPKEVLIDKKYRGMNAEQVYESFPDEDENGNGGGDGEGEGDDDGTGGLGKCSIGGDCGDLRPMTQQEVEEMRGKIIGAYEASKSFKSQNQGTIPAGLARAIEAMKEHKVPWHKIFHQFVGGALAKTDYMFSRPSRRSVVYEDDVYLPTLQSNVIGKVVIGVDTSGSIGEREISQFAAEIRKLNHLVEELVVITCDADVHEVVQLYHMDNFLKKIQFKGGGGTDFRPVFNYVYENGLAPDLLVYLTDSWGSFPDKTPEFPTLWVLTEKRHAEIPFGKYVIMDLDDD